MRADRKPPNIITAPIIEWRAGQIPDPIARLRYLHRATAPDERQRPSLRRRALRVLSLVAVLVFPLHTVSDATVYRRMPPPRAAAAERYPEVWLVESADEYEVFSNGLRIETRYAVSNRPRSYPVFEPGRPDAQPLERSVPAGIVFHTTESHVAPFEADQNGRLKQIGQSLLEYVRSKRAYHYVIDRFGRVYRVVAESDAADHAGYSVWADEKHRYLNLNTSFLGVAFEAETERGERHTSANPAQIRAARVLTEMLRSKYHLPASNCVTHAQVSVNPDNHRLGYHTDWGADFPFHELGLPDNYELPLAALWAFGFEYDPAFVNATGAGLRMGLALAEEQLREKAALAGVSTAEYRRTLQRTYRHQLAALTAASAFEEKHEQSQ